MDVYRAAWRGDIAVLNLTAPKLLMDVDTELGAGGYTPLMYAAYQGHVEALAFLLNTITSPDHLDRQNDAGCTPLYLAVQQCRVEAAELLLRHGADPRIRDRILGLCAADQADTEAMLAVFSSGRAGRRWTAPAALPSPLFFLEYGYVDPLTIGASAGSKKGPPMPSYRGVVQFVDPELAHPSFVLPLARHLGRTLPLPHSRVEVGVLDVTDDTEEDEGSGAGGRPPVTSKGKQPRQQGIRPDELIEGHTDFVHNEVITRAQGVESGHQWTLRMKMRPGKRYMVRVRAVNALGPGRWSIPSLMLTVEHASLRPSGPVPTPNLPDRLATTQAGTRTGTIPTSPSRLADTMAGPGVRSLRTRSLSIRPASRAASPPHTPGVPIDAYAVKVQLLRNRELELYEPGVAVAESADWSATLSSAPLELSLRMSRLVSEEKERAARGRYGPLYGTHASRGSPKKAKNEPAAGAAQHGGAGEGPSISPLPAEPFVQAEKQVPVNTLVPEPEAIVSEASTRGSGVGVRAPHLLGSLRGRAAALAEREGWSRDLSAEEAQAAHERAMQERADAAERERGEARAELRGTLPSHAQSQAGRELKYKQRAGIHDSKKKGTGIGALLTGALKVHSPAAQLAFADL